MRLWQSIKELSCLQKAYSQCILPLQFLLSCFVCNAYSGHQMATLWFSFLPLHCFSPTQYDFSHLPSPIIFLIASVLCWPCLGVLVFLLWAPPPPRWFSDISLHTALIRWTKFWSVNSWRAKHPQKCRCSACIVEVLHICWMNTCELASFVCLASARQLHWLYELEQVFLHFSSP